jgi:hypothetical protein
MPANTEAARIRLAHRIVRHRLTKRSLFRYNGRMIQALHVAGAGGYAR